MPCSEMAETPAPDVVTDPVLPTITVDPCAVPMPYGKKAKPEFWMPPLVTIVPSTLMKLSRCPRMPTAPSASASIHPVGVM